jgi:hypothetical protein
LRRTVLVSLVLFSLLGVGLALYAGWRATPQYEQVHHSPYLQP